MLSSYTIVRNAIELDYPIEECVRSLIPVSDEVLICDSDSTDGTKELLHYLCELDSRVRVINRPWPNPHRDINWFVEWINATRRQLRFPMQLQLDADEVLGEESYEEIRNAVSLGECRWLARRNFWGDAQHLAPHGHCCGEAVARLGPSSLWMPSDEPHPEGDPEIRKRASKHPSLNIYHYGFLRKPEAFYKKSRVVQNAFFGTLDKRVEALEEKKVQRWHEHCVFPEPLIPFRGRHPEVARQWLRERGYNAD